MTRTPTPELRRSATARRCTLAVLLCLALAVTSCTSSAPGDNRPAPTARDFHLPAGVEYRETTQEFGSRGPSAVKILSVHPEAKARVGGIHGKELAGTTTVRDLAKQSGARAAVNGSFFDIATGRHHAGFEGDPLGLYAEHGKILSEASNGRAALLLGYEQGRLVARVEETQTVGRLTAQDTAQRELDGVNRVPGRVLGCGGVGGDRIATTEEPMDAPYSGLCTDVDEVVQFTEQWSGRTPPGPPRSAEAVLAADGTVREVRVPAGGKIPAGGSTLYGIGPGAGWLQGHVLKGSRIEVTQEMTDGAGLAVVGPVDTAVGGSHRLLKNGAVTVAPNAAGGKPNPRTVAGVKADGTLLLVTIDGREVGVSAGATLAEAARYLASLGVVDAINLDGGGSTTMIVNGELRNRPRGGADDDVTERPVSNGIGVFGE
ncbi:phosphodiester glycosidase family protein [Streptomyces sp. NPDC096339]|uniref:phosphodiester glycosidase family protein n=1 Tax=Streptomyces sp. NPDC096339 TaxID=3366086 RepID=UPI003826CEDB